MSKNSVVDKFISDYIYVCFAVAKQQTDTYVHFVIALWESSPLAATVGSNIARDS